MGKIVATEAGDDIALLVVEEEAPLVGFVGGGGGHIDRLEGGWVDAGVICLGAEGHRRRSKILYLLEAVAHLFHIYSQLCHVLEAAARMAADEIRDELVAQSRLLAYLVTLRRPEV